jgi:hypothetical protein
VTDELVEVCGADVFELSPEQPATAVADRPMASAAQVWRVSMIGTFLGYPMQSAKRRLNPR